MTGTTLTEVTRDEFHERYPSAHLLRHMELVRIEGAKAAIVLQVDHQDRYVVVSDDLLALVRNLKELLRQLEPSTEDQILATLQRIEHHLERRNGPDAE